MATTISFTEGFPTDLTGESSFPAQCFLLVEHPGTNTFQLHALLAGRQRIPRYAQSEALDRIIAQPWQGKNLPFVGNLRGQTLAAETVHLRSWTQSIPLLIGLDSGVFAAPPLSVLHI